MKCPMCGHEVQQCDRTIALKKIMDKRQRQGRACYVRLCEARAFGRKKP